MFSWFLVSQTLLDGAFVAFWSGWKRLGGLLWRPVGSLLRTLTGARSQNFQFSWVRLRCLASFHAKDAFVGCSEGFPDAFWVAFGHVDGRFEEFSCDHCAGVSITSHVLRPRLEASSEGFPEAFWVRFAHVDGST